MYQVLLLVPPYDQKQAERTGVRLKGKGRQVIEQQVTGLAGGSEEEKDAGCVQTADDMGLPCEILGYDHRYRVADGGT
ncbi:MAG: hypothetical protein ACWGQW_21445 [bacterium]